MGISSLYLSKCVIFSVQHSKAVRRSPLIHPHLRQPIYLSYPPSSLLDVIYKKERYIFTHTPVWCPWMGKFIPSDEAAAADDDVNTEKE